MSISTIIMAATIVAVSCRSALLPDSTDVKSAGGNVIVLESLVSGEPGSGQKAHLEGEKLLLEGRNFSSIKEMVNILDEDKKGKSSDPEGTPETFSLVVPVARNFSSLKELFEILGEDSSTRPSKGLAGADLSYVKGTEEKSSDYVVFFTT